MKHRLRVLGTDVDYTSQNAGTTVRIRALIGAVMATHEIQAGPFEDVAKSSMRAARDSIVSPKIGDRVLIVGGAAYRVAGVGNTPNSPEWNLTLENDYEAE